MKKAMVLLVTGLLFLAGCGDQPPVNHGITTNNIKTIPLRNSKSRKCFA